MALWLLGTVDQKSLLSSQTPGSPRGLTASILSRPQHGLLKSMVANTGFCHSYKNKYETHAFKEIQISSGNK